MIENLIQPSRGNEDRSFFMHSREWSNKKLVAAAIFGATVIAAMSLGSNEVIAAEDNVSPSETNEEVILYDGLSTRDLQITTADGEVLNLEVRATEHQGPGFGEFNIHRQE